MYTYINERGTQMNSFINKKVATFNRFELELPSACVKECSGPGDKTEAVVKWARLIPRQGVGVRALREELSDYGCWDDEELSIDSDNWERIIWIGAGDINEGEESE